ncbi:MAG: panthothenate synthetase [Vicinamibacterales bacterium]
MRILMHVKLPHEPFNTAVRKGTVGDTMQRILGEAKPEAVYFTEYDGKRGAILIVDLADPSKLPSLAEPWFLSFNADVTFHPVMSPDDLGRSGIDTIGKKWPAVS